MQVTMHGGKIRGQATFSYEQSQIPSGRCARAQSEHCRKERGPSETWRGRKAGTDGGTTVEDRGRRNSRRIPPRRVRKGRSWRHESG